LWSSEEPDARGVVPAPIVPASAASQLPTRCGCSSTIVSTTREQAPALSQQRPALQVLGVRVEPPDVYAALSQIERALAPYL
jgi:hypothetical protein